MSATKTAARVTLSAPKKFLFPKGGRGLLRNHRSIDGGQDFPPQPSHRLGSCQQSAENIINRAPLKIVPTTDQIECAVIFGTIYGHRLKLAPREL